MFFRVEGGELFDRVVSESQFEEDIAKLLFYQMALSIQVVFSYCFIIYYIMYYR